jgi:polyhydroxyalkanoate synthesis regulator protein
MSSTKKIKCIVTGKQTIYSGDFLQKKIDEYGSVDELSNTYICKEVKSFLKKGYKISDIKDLLNVDDDVPQLSDDAIKAIEENFRKNSFMKEHTSFNDTLTNFTYNKSDSDVEQFINEYIIK